MKPDIANREDIDRLVSVFYGKLLEDNSINYIFNNVIKINMEAHLPLIADF